MPSVLNNTVTRRRFWTAQYIPRVWHLDAVSYCFSYLDLRKHLKLSAASLAFSGRTILWDGYYNNISSNTWSGTDPVVYLCSLTQRNAENGFSCVECTVRDYNGPTQKGNPPPSPIGHIAHSISKNHTSQRIVGHTIASC